MVVKFIFPVSFRSFLPIGNRFRQKNIYAGWFRISTQHNRQIFGSLEVRESWLGKQNIYLE